MRNGLCPICSPILACSLSPVSSTVTSPLIMSSHSHPHLPTTRFGFGCRSGCYLALAPSCHTKVTTRRPTLWSTASQSNVSTMQKPSRSLCSHGHTLTGHPTKSHKCLSQRVAPIKTASRRWNVTSSLHYYQALCEREGGAWDDRGADLEAISGAESCGAKNKWNNRAAACTC